MALFKTSEEIRRYIAVQQREDIDDILPDIIWAEEKFIIPVLGIDQYNDLNDAYAEDPETMTAAQTRLLKKVQMPLIHLAYGKNIVFKQVLMDGAGVHIVHEGNNKTAFQWQIEDIKEQYALEKGFDGLDFMLSFLEANKDDYPFWENSDAYTVSKQFFINSTVEFNRVVNISSSRRTFMALWPLMTTVEELSIEPVLGAAFFADLKDKIKAGTLSAQEEILVKKIQPVSAFLTASRAVLDLPLILRRESLILDYMEAVGDNIRSEKKASDKGLDVYAKSKEANGLVYLGRLKDYLQATASPTVFPLFYNSDLYISPEERSKTFYKNNSESKSFLM